MTTRFAIAVAGILFALATVGGASAEGARPATKPIPATWDWSKCKAEIDKSCAAVADKGNEAIYACLFEHDSLNSKECDGVHSAYEEATGRPAGPPK